MADNINYLALRAQQGLEKRIAAAANNLANSSTNGFKADDVLFREALARPARAEDRPRDIRFVRDAGLARDFAQGPIAQTNGPLDLAIEGEGFFTVQGEAGPLYTRDGAFQLNADGGLVTRDGRAVLDATGQPIVFDPRGQRPEIDAQGRIRVGAANVATLGLAEFENPAILSKIGDNLFDARGEADPTPFTGTLVQGAIEGSNVRPILELTELLQVSRAYQGAAQIVSDADDLRQRAIQRLSGFGA